MDSQHFVQLTDIRLMQWKLQNMKKIKNVKLNVKTS